MTHSHKKADTDRRSRSTSPCPSVSSNSNESVGQESKPTEVVTTVILNNINAESSANNQTGPNSRTRRQRDDVAGSLVRKPLPAEEAHRPGGAGRQLHDCKYPKLGSDVSTPDMYQLPSIFELPGLTYQRSTAPSPEPSPSPPYEDLEYARVQVPCRVTGRLRPISAMDGFAEGRAVNDRLAWDRWCATTDRVPERLDGYETEDSDLEWEEFEEKRRR